MKISLNYIRLSAITMVLLIHASEYVTATYGGTHNINFLDNIIYLVFFTIGRLGVPLFLFLTGYLLLDRDYSNEKLNYFYTSSVKRIILGSILGVFILLLYTWIRGSNALSIRTMLLQILFLELKDTGYSTQVWYMHIVIALYLFIPIIARGLKGIKLKTIVLILCLPIIQIFVVNDINRLLLILNIPLIENVIHYDWIEPYVIYMLLGWCLKQGLLADVSKKYLSIISIGAFILLVSLQIFAHQNGNEMYIWYNSILLLVTTLMLFELMSRLPEVNVAIITRLTKGVLIVYWVHTIYQDLLWQFVNQIVEGYAIRIVLLTILNLICSMVTALLIQEIEKRVKEYV